MEILQQCRIWHENDEYERIIEALDGISEEERTSEMDFELARAYNNLADPSDVNGRRMLKRAIELLSIHEKEFCNDSHWNFRMGYAFFYLNQDGIALHFFQKALEQCSEDEVQDVFVEDTKTFIEQCIDMISFPKYKNSFRKRMQEAWDVFLEKEGEIRALMDEFSKENMSLLLSKIDEALGIAFDHMSFELGKNGEKYDLILSMEGDVAKLIQLIYFRNHAPENVLKNWRILIGRQGGNRFALECRDVLITGDDVYVWIEVDKNKMVRLFLYCEKLVNSSKDRDWNTWFLENLVDQTIGEISATLCLDLVEVLETPREDDFILLSQLEEELEKRGVKLFTNSNDACVYYTFHVEPNRKNDVAWRDDIFQITSNCVSILNEYEHGESYSFDKLYADGAVAGYFIYTIHSLIGENAEETDKNIHEFRDELEEFITKNGGEEFLTMTGSALGVYNGYIDFIAWDLESTLYLFEEFFEQTDIEYVGFKTFHPDSKRLTMMDRLEDE